MKVIAKIDRCFLIEINGDEIANICNQTSDYCNIKVEESSGSVVNKEPQKLDIGDKIEVAPLYKRARDIVGEYNSIKSSISGIKSACTKFENSVKV